MNFDELVDTLLDPDNTDSIFLTNEEDGKVVEFEQIAYVPFTNGEGEIYDFVLLAPAHPEEGEPDDEAYIFKLDYDARCIVFEEDDKIADAVFEAYLDLCKEDE